MADFTIARVKYNVRGSLRDRFYEVSGSSGSTIPVGMTTVQQANCGPANGHSQTVGASATAVVTLVGGPFSSTVVEVIGN